MRVRLHQFRQAAAVTFFLVVAFMPRPEGLRAAYCEYNPFHGKFTVVYEDPPLYYDDQESCQDDMDVLHSQGVSDCNTYCSAPYLYHVASCCPIYPGPEEWWIEYAYAVCGIVE
jgi:hypothetical protein